MSKTKKTAPKAETPTVYLTPKGFIKLKLWHAEVAGCSIFVDANDITMVTDVKPFKSVNASQVTLNSGVQFFSVDSVEDILNKISESKVS